MILIALKKFLPFAVAGVAVYLLFVRKPSAAMKPANAPQVNPGNIQQLASTSTPGVNRLVSVVPTGSQVGTRMGGMVAADVSRPGGKSAINFKVPAGAFPMKRIK